MSCLGAACGMNPFTSYSVTWAVFVPEILSHNWRLIRFPRLSGGCWQWGAGEGGNRLFKSQRSRCAWSDCSIPAQKWMFAFLTAARPPRWGLCQDGVRAPSAFREQVNLGETQSDFYVFTAPPGSINAEASQRAGSLKCLMSTIWESIAGTFQDSINAIDLLMVAQWEVIFC